mmetsp:Transcript_2693/g.6323  ORF Transcript_2693/g.6323 Transcript_2693/m.6323 type:complete len:112 (-) Transcript_2693:174-509(-)
MSGREGFYRRGFGIKRHRHYMPPPEQNRSATQMVNSTQTRLKDMSAGLTGIFLAMHICYEVDVYGFGHSGAYYYPKLKRTDRKWERIHFWELEHLCQQAHENYLDKVRFHW